MKLMCWTRSSPSFQRLERTSSFTQIQKVLILRRMPCKAAMQRLLCRYYIPHKLRRQSVPRRVPGVSRPSTCGLMCHHTPVKVEAVPPVRQTKGLLGARREARRGVSGSTDRDATSGFTLSPDRRFKRWTHWSANLGYQEEEGKLALQH